MKYQLNKIYSDYTNVHQICQDALHVSDKAKINAVLIGGSLLGMIRDGDLLPWDKDVDFAVFEPEVQDILSLEQQFRTCGFECRVHHIGVRKNEELDEGLSLLKLVCAELSSIQIQYCLINGTFLSLYRDNQFHPENDTIAVLVQIRDMEEAVKVKAKLKRFGKVYINKNGTVIKSVSLVTESWRLNLFQYVEESDKYGWKDLNCEHWFTEPLFPSNQFDLAGVNWSIPKDPEAFLTARYGVSWKSKPILSVSSGRVPGSIQLYKDGVMVDYIFHYVRGEKTYWFEPKANVISSKGFIPYHTQKTPLGDILLPEHPEIFLEEHYGDWKTPVKSWDGAVDNPTLIASDEAMRQILSSYEK